MTTFGKKPANGGFGKRKPGGFAAKPRPKQNAQNALSAEAMAFLEMERGRGADPAYVGNSGAGQSAMVGDKPVFGSRIFAFLIDTLIITVPFFVIMFPSLWAELEANEALYHSNPDQYDLQVQLMVIKWGLMHGIIRAIYSISMENWKGATLGKMVMGIVVANNDGGKASLVSIILRNTFGRFVTNLIPFYIGYFLALSNEKRKCVHDMIAGSTVRKKAVGQQDVSAIFA
ncbi:MAG: RDD family protein [Pseudomonadota bacterium]